MREILFKAKRIGNGEWVEGVPIKTHLGLFISFEEKPHYCSQYGYIEINDIAIVEEETLCQFTGLCDKNGKRIWEGDIISYQRDNDDCPFPNKDTKKRFGKVFYQGFRLTFAIGMGRNGSRSINDDLWKYVQNGNRVDVIGNVFDNSELLQEVR